MIKILEIIGFVLLGIMILSFVGLFPQQGAGLTPIFWICAVGILAIIFFRKKLRK